jgi:serine/threonine-protein kinase PknG
MHDPAGAIDAYGRVLDTSSAHADALIAQAELLLDTTGTDAVRDMVRAATLIEQVPADREQRAPLRARALERALALVRGGDPSAAAGGSVLGVPLREDELRRGLESAYRALARKAGSEEERIALVDRANRVRPRSWW